jgi:Fe-Mn family superoxide dismutase
MFESLVYKPKQFNLSGGLTGISDKTLEMHLKLYEGYVKNVNGLNEKISEFLKDGKIDQEEMPAYSELTRRLGYEYNGMVLHEHYFGNLTRGGSPKTSKPFATMAENSFGSYDTWMREFVGVGMMRGVGWAICYQDPRSGAVSNHWITQHESGHVAGFTPLLVMDVWEHAFVLDYAPADRQKYIDAFFSNVDWDAVEKRLTKKALSPAA